MLFLGIDVGSSSVKASVIDGGSGKCLATAFSPKDEMKILSLKPGWAEQEPEEWWFNLRLAVQECISRLGPERSRIGAIGIAYQMHGLVIIDRNGSVLRPAIIWCDSRAVSYGEKAFDGLGSEFCLTHLLNSPGNFTASKLAWVKENEPEIYDRIYKILLPGDYVAMRMTGEIMTSFSGLSEGVFWDFRKSGISTELMDFFAFNRDLIADPQDSFFLQGCLTKSAAAGLGLPEGIPVAYRAGDQPNNALSLNVLDPGEVAATAGTSGVIYGITDQTKYDRFSRVNTFLHVNHSVRKPRLGVLLCINGTGILNSWLKKYAGCGKSYEEMNLLAAGTAPGADGLAILPFGNGAERILMNRDIGCRISGLNFNRHSNAHLYRAAQEGIAFAFRYGLDIMKETGIDPDVIRAGSANLFLSPVFRETLACITGVEIHLYNTDGSLGAARGAGIGCGYYKSAGEAFAGLAAVGKHGPDSSGTRAYDEAYHRWKELLSSV